MSHKVLVQTDEYIPAGISGITMDKVGDSKEGKQEFTFVWSESYQIVHQAYLSCVQSGNPQTLALLVQQHPFHVEALFQLSEYLKSTGDLKNAGELVERILYTCETCAHPHFDWLSGNSSLDFSKEENKTIYLALFRHIEYLGRRGCARTALEFCKGLISSFLSLQV